MKTYFIFLFTIFFIISCKKQPYQNIINNLKNLQLSNEEFPTPFSQNFQLTGSIDRLEYQFLINVYGTEIKGNIFVPQKNIFYEFQGNIDVTGSFIANVLSVDSQWIDTLKGYFVQEEIKCAFAQNYDNVLLGTVHKPKNIPIYLYSLKLSGKSSNYLYEPKPKLWVHHTYLSTQDTHQKFFRSELSRIFFHKVLLNRDSIYNQMSKEILQYKEQFELAMKTAPKTPIESLNRTWRKSFEVVYNQDSIVSFYYLNHQKEGAQVHKQFQTFVFDFRKNRFLTVQDFTQERADSIIHFLFYPNFIRIWKQDGSYQNIPVHQHK